jgi:hypothetical protein
VAAFREVGVDVAKYPTDVVTLAQKHLNPNNK